MAPCEDYSGLGRSLTTISGSLQVPGSARLISSRPFHLPCGWRLLRIQASAASPEGSGMRSVLSVCCVLVLTAAGVSAHDFWLAAADWRPAPGAPATVTAGIGEHFPTRTPTRMQADAFEEWRVLGAAGSVPASKDFVKAGNELTTTLTLPAAGAY